VRCMPRLKLLLAAFVLIAVSAPALVGCGPTGPEWVESGGTYTTGSLATLYSKADISKLASQTPTDVAKLRHDALTGLRQRGSAAAAAADLITKTLPTDTRGVPVYVEQATVGGQPAVIVIEATGRANGPLSTKRLWAISDKGAVLFVGNH